MSAIIITIIAIILALLIVGFIWKLLKTVIKVVLVVVIAMAIFGLLTNVLHVGKQDIPVDNSTMENVTNATGEITAQVTGFVSKTFEKAKLHAQKAVAENVLENAKSDLQSLED